MDYKYINYKNTKIHYYEKGKGSTLVLLHGFLENLTMWQPYFDTLSQKHRVIAVDLLGHGNTECMGYIHTMEDMADAVFALISDLKLRKITIIGHSMGGYVALAFAELYPDHIKGIALVASTSRADSPERKTNRDRAIELIKRNSSTFINIAISNLFEEEERTTFQKEIENVKAQALQMPVQGIVAALEGMKIRADREVILHFAPYPITLITGKKDTVMPYEENITQITDTKVTLISLPGGHMLHIENKDELQDSLLQFIKTNKL